MRIAVATSVVAIVLACAASGVLGDDSDSGLKPIFDGSSGAGNEDRAAGDTPLDIRLIQPHLLSAQQILN